jgi:hypothetical protein
MRCAVSVVGLHPALGGAKDEEEHFPLAADSTGVQSRRISLDGVNDCLAQTTHDSARFMRVHSDTGYNSSTR